MIARVNFVGDLTGSYVTRTHERVDHLSATCQQPATLNRRVVTGMRDQTVQYCPGNLQRHASMIVAVPIPPPTHSVASPRLALRA